ncbi:unnamed protein product [Trichogramma brassicae]|uniref:Uncharacterized protein n=1 Tax=Trichogramma brassicae TaxID=86971 RepID=A0A6H5I3S5_9HYME|nr:unnamed protein product [Trichogramma brassicae]
MTSLGSTTKSSRTKEIAMRDDDSGLSLYDLIQLRPTRAVKQLTYFDCFEFTCSYELWDLPVQHRVTCAWHLNLCEMMPREFFRPYALNCFSELIHYRLQDECSEMIIETLTARDLCNICLATTKPISRPSHLRVMDLAQTFFGDSGQLENMPCYVSLSFPCFQEQPQNNWQSGSQTTGEYWRSGSQSTGEYWQTPNWTEKNLEVNDVERVAWPIHVQYMVDSPDSSIFRIGKRRLLRGHTLLASPPELSIRTRCLVPSCECGSRFRRYPVSLQETRVETQFDDDDLCCREPTDEQARRRASSHHPGQQPANQSQERSLRHGVRVFFREESWSVTRHLSVASLECYVTRSNTRGEFVRWTRTWRKD